MGSRLEVREIHEDAELLAAFPLMAVLRARLTRETFLSEIRRQQADGYRLLGGFEEGALVALAGIRRSHTLARGEHLFVDDLVTAEAHRGRGHGRSMLIAIAERAKAEGVKAIFLDSRDTARGFYQKVGFDFLTSSPCRIDAAKLTFG